MKNILFALVVIFMSQGVAVFVSAEEYSCYQYVRGQARCASYGTPDDYHICKMPTSYTPKKVSKSGHVEDTCQNACGDALGVPNTDPFGKGIDRWCMFSFVLDEVGMQSVYSRLGIDSNSIEEEALLVVEPELIEQDEDDFEAIDFTVDDSGDDSWFEDFFLDLFNDDESTKPDTSNPIDDSNEGESGESAIVGSIKTFIEGAKESIINTIAPSEEEDEFYTTEEDFETDPYGSDSDFNTFATREWVNGTEIARMVDPYGKEQFTSDGKHFYDNEYDAAHSQEGLSNIVNVTGGFFTDMTDFLFRGKHKDSDIQLQNSIAGEVLSDSQSESEKDVEKAYEKISGKIKTPTGGDIPAKVIVMVAEESKKADFAQGVRRYISERKKGNDSSFIRENFSKELSEGFGTFGKGVSQGTVAKQAEGVLYARYEESYQRYLLAKQMGRIE